MVCMARHGKLWVGVWHGMAYGTVWYTSAWREQILEEEIKKMQFLFV